ncbi:MAG: hypothetical protein E6G87_02860 [Alphaproteobacteria bacterium]|nr:MAG: hypothetical protein E6G87_02860 [Alphaproteobacteria bacterium]
MVFSFSNVIGALIFLVFGVICLALYQRFIRPLLIVRHEKAKVTATQGRDPAQVTRIVYLIGLLVFPLVGFLLGGLLF